MKTLSIQIEVYEPGDIVHTPDGYCTVVEDRVLTIGRYEKHDNDVKVRLHDNTSNHDKGSVIDVERECIIYERCDFEDGDVVKVRDRGQFITGIYRGYGTVVEGRGLHHKVEIHNGMKPEINFYRHDKVKRDPHPTGKSDIEKYYA